MQKVRAVHGLVRLVLVCSLGVSTGVGASLACSSIHSLSATPTQVARAESGNLDSVPAPRSPGPATTAPQDDDANDGFPVAVVNPNPMARVLRGDFEPPDTLVIAYEPEWAHSVEQLVAAARGQARVLLLSPPELRWQPGVLRLSAQKHVKVIESKIDTPWVRDYGPLQTYEVEAGPLWLDFKYALDRPRDDQVPGSLSALLQARLEVPSVALDGGAVIGNGTGLCAITRTSLIDAGMVDPDDGSMEVFLSSLGCRATAVLPSVPRESTGHADVVAQFLSEDLVMVAWLDPKDNREISEALDEAANHLASAADLGGYYLQVVRIPIAATGETFYSYVNATRLRSKLLVPHFQSMRASIQQSAYVTLETALPGVQLVPIDSDPMVELGGAVHCITLGLGPSRPPTSLPALEHGLPVRHTRLLPRG